RAPQAARRLRASDPPVDGRRSPMRGRRIIAMLAALVALATGAAVASEVVKVGALGNTGDGPFLIGVERGYFKERGIEVKFQQFAGAAGGKATAATRRLRAR